MYHVGLPLMLSSYLHVCFKWKAIVSEIKQAAIVSHKYRKCVAADTQLRKLSEAEEGWIGEDMEVRAAKS